MTTATILERLKFEHGTGVVVDQLLPGGALVTQGDAIFRVIRHLGMGDRHGMQLVPITDDEVPESGELKLGRDLRGVSVFVHTPTYNGWVATEYCFGLIDAMMSLGVRFQAKSEMGPLIARHRDELTTQFAEGDASHMLCIDADICFGAADLARLLVADRDIVAGCYPRKNSKRDLPAARATEVEPSSSPLVSAKFAPAGFMLISRDAIRAMAEQVDDSEYYAHNGRAVLPLWHAPRDENGRQSFCGEDVAFCQRARAAGFDIWVHTDVRLKHYGMHHYEFDPGPIKWMGDRPS